MFILVDANSFFCHCEKLFRPDLKNREVVVLSNNDGCIVSATRGCKKSLHLKTGQPFFEVEDLLKKNKVEVFSSNFSLYTKISKRLSDILKTFSNNVEVYSIDECFLYFPKIKNIDWDKFGQQIKNEVLNKLGMPVSVGIGKTKVLAKICNYIAKDVKSLNGVCFYQDNNNMDLLLNKIPVHNIWGIGNAAAFKLRSLQIKTVLDLKKYKNKKKIKLLLSKTGLQILEELNEINCFYLNNNPSLRKSILCSRTFSIPISNKENLKSKLASFITSACTKLRLGKGKIARMEIFIIKKNDTYLDKNLSDMRSDSSNYLSIGVELNEVTSNTLTLIAKGEVLLDKIFVNGEVYKKAGVIFSNISYNAFQMSLFRNEMETKRSNNLLKVIDQINNKMGQDALFSAACLGQKVKRKDRRELYRQNYRSASFLTNWKDIPSAF